MTTISAIIGTSISDNTTRYVMCTSFDYGQDRGFRVQVVGDRTFNTGDTLSDGTNTRIIDGFEIDGVNFTIALVTEAVPPTWIDGSGYFPLIITYI